MADPRRSLAAGLCEGAARGRGDVFDADDESDEDSVLLAPRLARRPRRSGRALRGDGDGALDRERRVGESVPLDEDDEGDGEADEADDDDVVSVVVLPSLDPPPVCDADPLS